MSAIDTTQPPEGAATTAAVRANFTAAKQEIEALTAQFDDPTKFHDHETFRHWACNYGSKIFIPYIAKFAAVGSTAMVAGRRHALPFFVPRDMQVANLRLQITAAHASNFQVGVYAADVTNPLMPGEKLWATGEISANSTGVITMPVNAGILKNTLYYLLMHWQGSPTVRNFAGTDLLPFFPRAATSVDGNFPLLAETVTYATLPQNLSTSLLIPASQSFAAVSVEKA